MSLSKQSSKGPRLRDVVKLSDREFDTKTLPADMQRVHKTLAKAHGDEYALTVIFAIRTCEGLHKAWHMGLLTNKILQQLKDRFRLRMTWDLGVLKVQFRMSDGAADLFRKVRKKSCVKILYVLIFILDFSCDFFFVSHEIGIAIASSLLSFFFFFFIFSIF